MADTSCRIIPYEERLPTLGDRVAVFMDVSYVPAMYARLNGHCPPTLAQAFKDGYAFKIIVGKKCDGCRPIWVSSKTWEEQPEYVDGVNNKGLLRDHIVGVYMVQVESLDDRTGFVDEGIIVNLDKPEEVKFDHPPGYVRLPQQLVDLIRGSLPFFREERGYFPPFIQNPSLLRNLEEASHLSGSE